MKKNIEKIEHLTELLQKGIFWIAKDGNGRIRGFKKQVYKNPFYDNWQYNRTGRGDAIVPFEIDEISWSDEESTHMLDLIKLLNSKLE